MKAERKWVELIHWADFDGERAGAGAGEGDREVELRGEEEAENPRWALERGRGESSCGESGRDGGDA